MSDDLDDLFGLARAQGPMAVPQGLQARILADAAAAQPRPAAAAPRRSDAAPASASGGWFGGALAGLAGVFGGSGALAGMSVATLAGLYLGLAQPAVVTSLAQGWTGDVPLESLELLPGDTALWTED